MNHQTGQHRAELFDELIARLVAAMYPSAQVTRKLPYSVSDGRVFRSVSIDFKVDLADGTIIIETKAPYTDRPFEVIEKTLNRLKIIAQRLSIGRVRTFILAIPLPFPEELRGLLADIEAAAGAENGTVKIWDERALLDLVRLHLSTEIQSFSLDDLRKALGKKSVGEFLVIPAPGWHRDVVILVADFCSFTKFVAASGSKTDLLESMMSRFYRETRQTIEAQYGVIDKYMGDGVLAYWLGPDAGVRIERCLANLIGLSVSLAEDWSDNIKYAVDPKGLRAGATIDDVLFVSEDDPPKQPFHAISDGINLAARLQGAAKPNSLMIDNLLHHRFFNDSQEFVEIPKLEVKNSQDLRVWMKTFVTPTANMTD